MGEEFTVRIDTHAEAKNRKGGGSAEDCQATFASAYLRDPSEIGGGTVLETSGLEPTNRPLPEPPVGGFVEPAACAPGPGPLAAAGTLQFDAASYRIDEFSGAVSTVTVTRTGGSSGAVSATFTTSDGTASGGTVNSCSAERCSTARLVTKIFRPGANTSNSPICGAAAITCSILSSSKSTCRR